MNLRERCQAVFGAGYQLGQQSFRTIAARLQMSKSSVHRFYHRISKRNQYPESSLWETEAGQQWLSVLVWATIFVFSLQGGCGCERLSEFFHLLRLPRHIGVSPTALRTLRSRLEEKILSYQQQQQAQQLETGQSIALCAAADEKFFEQVVLVLLDLPSGYILVEELTENRQYSTWQTSAQQLLSSVGFSVKYFVSDRAKALVKLALNDLGCPSVADVFHALFNLSKGLGWELNSLANRLQKRLYQAHQNKASTELIEQLETEMIEMQKSQEAYQDCCHCLSTSLHPFAIADSSTQNTLEVKTLLVLELEKLKKLKQNHKLKDLKGSLDKFQRQISELTAVVDLWWSWVDCCLSSGNIDSHLSDWVKQQLLPAFYWQQQVRRTKNPSLRRAYQVACEQAFSSLMPHPTTASLGIEERQQWFDWASWMVSKC